MASRTDDNFWARQDSVHPRHDHPALSSTPIRPKHPHVELLIATPAGKPLFYFAYNGDNHHHPCSASSFQTARPDPAISSLSATLSAFQAATNNTVSIIKSARNTLLTHVHDALHIALLARHNPAPMQFLQALIRIAIATIYATLSASLSKHLREHPSSRPSLKHLDSFLNAVLLDAITHPQSYVLQRSIALPSHTYPSTRLPLSQLLRRVVSRHPKVTHALLFTTGPPLPVRLVASCGPANNELSPIDVLLLSSLPASGEPSLSSSFQFFPHSKMFHVGLTAFSSLLQLRLHPDHHDTFKRAVGGQFWRPEWTHSPPHTLRVIALCQGDATKFVDALEHALDRSFVTTHLLIDMELPLFLNHSGVSGFRALVAIHNANRIGGTVNAFSYQVSMACFAAMRKSRDLQPAQNLTITLCPTWKLRVVSWKRVLMLCFDICVSENDAFAAARNVFIPWFERYKHAIVPHGDRIGIQPPTPLSGIIAPFDS